ncbi:MAG TPA: hypothetical protein VJN32_06165 [Dehalococcoidia bacterium]|nr:hypothetical protein [Dehalococcoidia bacterium]
MLTDTKTPGEDRVSREAGQALSEYALLLVFIFAVCILAVGGLAAVVFGELQNFVGLFP